MEWALTNVYMGCALVGGAVLTIQFVLLLFGGDGDGDGIHVDHHDVAHDPLGFLSIRAIAAFLTFFGLTGWWGTDAGWGSLRTMLAAVGAGGMMMGAVAWLVSLQRKLHSEGNIDVRTAVGQHAQVYLRIPGNHGGKGKITVSLQGRAKQFDAVTSGPDLPTGSEVRVLHMTTPNTFEVAALE